MKTGKATHKGNNTLLGWKVRRQVRLLKGESTRHFVSLKATSLCAAEDYNSHLHSHRGGYNSRTVGGRFPFQKLGLSKFLKPCFPTSTIFTRCGLQFPEFRAGWLGNSGNWSLRLLKVVEVGFCLKNLPMLSFNGPEDNLRTIWGERKKKKKKKKRDLQFRFIFKFSFFFFSSRFSKAWPGSRFKCFHKFFSCGYTKFGL